MESLQSKEHILNYTEEIPTSSEDIIYLEPIEQTYCIEKCKIVCLVSVICISVGCITVWLIGQK